jgi:hypothetical protein
MTGPELERTLRQEAHKRGVRIEAFVHPLGFSKSFIYNLPNISSPKPHTIAKCKALIAGEPMPRKPLLLIQAVRALGAMPEGYCFCSKDRIGDDSKTHEPECADLRAALERLRA